VEKNRFASDYKSRGIFRGAEKKAREDRQYYPDDRPSGFVACEAYTGEA